MAEQKSRNQTVDILRGIAMLLVVLGHTLTGVTENSEESFLFNVIWTLQMPLFMLISGYVTKFSRPVDSGKGFLKFLGKKTLAYLVPWAIWTFLVRGVIFGYKQFLNVKWILYHMDSGYWFIFALWMIVIIFGLSELISNLICKKNKYAKLFVHAVAYVIGMAGLAVVGIMAGMSFLCIKLTLYYMPFYFAGFLFGQFDGELSKTRFWKIAKDVSIALSFVLWIFLMNQFHFFDMDDNIMGIALRAVASLTGCIAICGLISKAAEASSAKAWIFLKNVGVHSLEIYLIHYIMLAMLRMNAAPEFASVKGICLVILNFVLTAGLSYGLAILLNKNRVLGFALFGKKK